jgi:hypothetical protein
VPRLLVVPPARYLAVPGVGVPGEAELEEAAARLLEVARALRARVRRARGKDFRVPPIEVLWRGDGPADAAAGHVPWRWKLMLRVPAFVRPSDAAQAGAGVPGAGLDPRLEDLEEGRCLQALWTGTAPRALVLGRLRAAAAERGLAFRGRLHEVWLSDPRRVAPERRRAILRRPVRAR